MQLKIPVLYETIDTLHSLVGKLENIVDGKDNIIYLDSLTIEAQDLLIKQLDNFWKNRFVWSIGVSYIYVPATGKTHLGFGTNVGVRLWGNE
jgi:hypothetical protein